MDRAGPNGFRLPSCQVPVKWAPFSQATEYTPLAVHSKRWNAEPAASEQVRSNALVFLPNGICRICRQAIVESCGPIRLDSTLCAVRRDALVLLPTGIARRLRNGKWVRHSPSTCLGLALRCMTRIMSLPWHFKSQANCICPELRPLRTFAPLKRRRFWSTIRHSRMYSRPILREGSGGLHRPSRSRQRPAPATAIAAASGGLPDLSVGDCRCAIGSRPSLPLLGGCDGGPAIPSCRGPGSRSLAG